MTRKTRSFTKVLTSLFVLLSFLTIPLTPAFAIGIDPSAADTPDTSTAIQIVDPEASIIDTHQNSQTVLDNNQTISKDVTNDPTPVDDKGLQPIDKKLTPPMQQSALIGGGTPGSIAITSGLRTSLTPDIDTLSGALIYKYGIKVPPGRNDTTTPDIALVYNSASSTTDSIIGSGWTVNIPNIERINKKGTNNLYSNDDYSSSLSGELTKLNSTDYVAKVEKGDFLKYTKLTNGWLVTDKNGTKYTFGANAQARQDNPSNTAQIFKWMLEEVRDTNDNYISYTYYKDAGQIYPSQIVYSGYSATPGVLEVNFDRTSRTNAPVLYNTSFSVQSNYRITEIRTEVNNVWARKYTLAYTTGDNGIGSLLDTIIESGQDDSSAVTTLPAINFDYQTSSNNWTYSSTLTTNLSNAGTPQFATATGADGGVRMADINGDGLLDILCRNDLGQCSGSYPAVLLNDGAGGWTDVSSTWLFPLIGGTGSNRESFLTQSGTAGSDKGLRAFDINGDGLADLVKWGGFGGGVYINNGSGWTYSSTLTTNLSNAGTPQFVTSSGFDGGVRMADINGDGLLDLICRNDSGQCSGSYPAVLLNDGAGGWTDVSSTWLFPLIQGTGSTRESFLDISGYGGADKGMRAVDINGDGLADLVKWGGYGGGVYINNGSGWTYNATLTSNLANASFGFPQFAISANGYDGGVRIEDINGDGLLDVICRNDALQCSGSYPVVALNDGAGGWTDVSSTWLFPLIQGTGSTRESFLTHGGSGGSDKGMRAVDINGDGLADLVKWGGFGGGVYTNNTTVQSNLLTKITYPQGGYTTISYKASPLYRNGSSMLNPTLPMTLDIVNQIVTNDGLGTTQSNTYEYEGGAYYFNTSLDRKFAGFNSIKVTDAAGNVKKTYYYQGNSTNTSLGEYNDHVSKIGVPYRVEEYDTNGNLYRLAVDKLDRYNIGTDHDFVKVIRHTVLDYDGNSGHKDTATESTYDDTNGNVLTKTEWGEVTGSTDGSFTDTGSDKRLTTYAYAINGTTLVNVPDNETVTDQSGSKVKENKYYYDSFAFGSVTKGNQTKVEQWVTASTYINSQNTYNANGTVATSTDPRGKVTTNTTYDSYNLYPLTITYPLSQTMQYVYDYSLGKPKQTTDKNGFVYQTVYDGLDRVTSEKIPDFTTPFTPVTKTLYTYTDTSGAVKVQRTDYLDGTITADTYQYYDGLGRLIQERKEAETAGNFNVKDTVYNTVGLVQKQSLPYTSSGSAKTTATATTSLYGTNTYDPLQRLLTVVDATGTTTYAYDDWKTTVTDKNSKVKNYYKDAYGNLIKVDEINGASTYTTNYVWNLNNKLTRITDALSNVRNFTYDGIGRRLTAEDLHASGDATYGTWTYSYDNAGNITQSISPNALTTNYTYNDINQVLTEDTTSVAGTEITNTYGGCTNGIGKLCSVTMTSGANTSYTYDSNGNMASEIKTINSIAYTTSYTYDRQGNVLTITYPDSAQVKYTFNTAGLLEKIERKESGGSFTNVISNFDYSPADQITTQAYPNTVTTTNTYDATKLYRLTRKLTQNTVPSKLQDLNYTYDNAGNITQIIDASNTNSSKTAVYVYDDLYRMTSATITAVASGQSTYTHTYAYDALGNITSGPIGTYLYQGNTGVLKANPHAATSINAVTQTHDSDGNLTTNGTLTNTWNYRDQITQTVNGATTVNYYYDYNGDRVWYKVGAVNTYYPNKYYSIDTASKKIKQIYAGNQLVATVETVSAVVTPYYVHTDQLNSTTASSDGTGALVETLDYYPFGAQRISSGAHTEKRQYIGQIYDSETGLDYLNARYYKADIGRFISEDSMFWNFDQTWLTDPQNQNSYSYARNNPILLSDPTGKAFIIDDAAGFLVGGLVGSGTQLIIGAVTGKGTTFGELGGSFVTGGIIGWGAVNTPETLGASNVVAASMVAGFTGGFYGNATKQGIDIATGKQTGGFNAGDLRTSAPVTGFTSGVLQSALPNAKITGLSAGRNNMSAIGEAMRTKATNGIINNMSTNTALKSAVGSQSSDLYRTIAGGIMDSMRSTYSNKPNKENAKKQK